MEFGRKLYTRGSSFETTIPKPLLFNINTHQKNVVHFIYDAEKARWYIEIRQEIRPEKTRESIDLKPPNQNSESAANSTASSDSKDQDSYMKTSRRRK